MTEMYFYKICAYGYEESYEKTFISQHKYTNEEFEDIILDCYHMFCCNTISEEPTSLCYYNIFFSVEFSIFSTEFYKLLKDEYDIHILHGDSISAKMVFDLTHSQPNENQEKLDAVFSSLKCIDESCWDNHCSRIADEDAQERAYSRRDCGVARRKCMRLKERGCFNCEANDPDSDWCNTHTYETCNSWHWNGSE